MPPRHRVTQQQNIVKTHKNEFPMYLHQLPTIQYVQHIIDYSPLIQQNQYHTFKKNNHKINISMQQQKKQHCAIPQSLHIKYTPLTPYHHGQSERGIFKKFKNFMFFSSKIILTPPGKSKHQLIQALQYNFIPCMQKYKV
eukprot:TRINITY_DN11285_c0_g1_i6.p4 TRINITY_DN11285_c0_g1~~TRINITY_DN11285_c0_g1_i6.p4  ORF type:complete len:140 (-),score=0.83 TRINITY_DN11285_c0_g1_i6:1483-1902(-)